MNDLPVEQPTKMNDLPVLEVVIPDPVNKQPITVGDADTPALPNVPWRDKTLKPKLLEVMFNLHEATDAKLHLKKGSKGIDAMWDDFSLALFGQPEFVKYKPTSGDGEQCFFRHR
jgi:hypothetical protein